MKFYEGINQIEKANRSIEQAYRMVAETTIHAFLFTWRWWIGVGMIIIPWLLWAIFRKKESSARLLFSAFIFVILATQFDTIGVGYGKWSYPIKVVPLPTISYVYLYSFLPVLFMFFIQIRPNIHPLIKAILFGLVSSYVGLPILSMLDMYKRMDWAYTYSFFILIFLYLIAYWFSLRKSFAEI